MSDSDNVLEDRLISMVTQIMDKRDFSTWRTASDETRRNFGIAFGRIYGSAPEPVSDSMIAKHWLFYIEGMAWQIHLVNEATKRPAPVEITCADCGQPMRQRKEGGPLRCPFCQ